MVQPQVAVALSIINGALPVFLKVNVWFTTAPALIFPKSCTFSLKVITGAGPAGTSSGLAVFGLLIRSAAFRSSWCVVFTSEEEAVSLFFSQLARVKHPKTSAV